MDILGKLFGGNTKVKLMRLFVFNQDSAYTMKEVVSRSKSTLREAKKGVQELINIGLVKKKPVVREESVKRHRKVIIKKKHDKGYTLDTKFPYLQALKNLVITASLHADHTLAKRFDSAGKIKFFVASGLFIQEWDTRIDLLVVGDNLNMSRLETLMKTIESEIGREIAYSAFETNDFEYRLGIHDRLVRDILDLPHTTIVDKLGVEERG